MQPDPQSDTQYTSNVDGSDPINRSHSRANFFCPKPYENDEALRNTGKNKIFPSYYKGLDKIYIFERMSDLW
jgi:hypothetical protein